MAHGIQIFSSAGVLKFQNPESGLLISTKLIYNVNVLSGPPGAIRYLNYSASVDLGTNPYIIHFYPTFVLSGISNLVYNDTTKIISFTFTTTGGPQSFSAMVYQ